MINRLLRFGNKFMQEKMEATSSFLQRMLETSKDIEKSTKQIKIIYVILYVFLAFGMIQQIVSVIFLRSALFPKAPLVFMLGIFASGITFIFSTNVEFFNFRRRKKANLFVVILYMTMTVVAVLSFVYCEIFLPIIFLIPINPDITKSMVVGLARLLYLLFLCIPAGLLLYEVTNAVYRAENWEGLDAFKIRKFLDLRKDKEFLYDLNIIRRMEDGKTYTIKESDRQRHMILNGVTGTGKTSSGLVPAVASDLDKKAHNEDYIKKELV